MENRIVKYLNLRDVGLLEMMIAFYPIIAGYSYGVIKGNLFFIMLTALVAIFVRNKHTQYIKYTWLICLIIFVALHEFCLMLTIPVEGSFINNTISILVISFCIIPIIKATNYHKLIGSLNWVSILTIIGLLYQVSIVLAGGKVSPLKLPFMPDMASGTRLYEVVIRPASFFWEPAAMATFLMVPMFISLTQKKYIWTGIIMISMFLSTSSTGILMSFVMLAVYVLTQKIKFSTRILIVVLGIVMGGFLLNSHYFEYGINKIERTDPEKNARLMNGIILFDEMSLSDKICGIREANVDDFFKTQRIKYFGYDTAFVPAFWLTWAKYGIFGLIIFLGMYLSILKKNRSLLPYIVVLFISMFFQSISIGSSGFAYQLIFLYTYIKKTNIRQNNAHRLKQA